MADGIRDAIERHLDKVDELWEAFAADPMLRLVRWRGDVDDLRLVDLFVDLQSEEIGTAPDVFVCLSTPFENRYRYVAEAAADLVQNRLRTGARFH